MGCHGAQNGKQLPCPYDHPPCPKNEPLHIICAFCSTYLGISLSQFLCISLKGTSVWSGTKHNSRKRCFPNLVTWGCWNNIVIQPLTKFLRSNATQLICQTATAGVLDLVMLRLSWTSDVLSTRFVRTWSNQSDCLEEIGIDSNIFKQMAFIAIWRYNIIQ